MISVGLDLSLTHTGFAIIKDDQLVLSSGVIKSKPCGDKPIDETKRIIKIAEDVMEEINKALPEINPDLVCIEGLSFMSQGTSLVQLAGLNYLIRFLLNQFNWPFLIVAPTTLKKFITGSGRADKDLMMLEVFKRWGFSSLNSDICDAYALAKVGGAMLESKEIKTKEQKECIQLLKKQL
jgi:Holliday junction resolvasome RuvABC endonuclease subunit